MCSRSCLFFSEDAWLRGTDAERVVTERETALIAQELSPRVYFSLGKLLGLTQSRLEQIQFASPHSPVSQLCHMLSDWLQQQHKLATVRALVTALSQARVDVASYRHIILEESSRKRPGSSSTTNTSIEPSTSSNSPIPSLRSQHSTSCDNQVPTRSMQNSQPGLSPPEPQGQESMTQMYENVPVQESLDTNVSSRETNRAPVN